MTASFDLEVPTSVNVIRRVVKSIARFLDDDDRDVTVIGHTDNRSLRSSTRFVDNWDLSDARAEAVAALLRSTTQGRSQIDHLGRAATDPIADNNTPEGQARNRRVEIVVRK